MPPEVRDRSHVEACCLPAVPAAGEWGEVPAQEQDPLRATPSGGAPGLAFSLVRHPAERGEGSVARGGGTRRR